MSVNVGSATGYLDLDISEFLTGLRTAQTEANRQSQGIAKIQHVLPDGQTTPPQLCPDYPRS